MEKKRVEFGKNVQDKKNTVFLIIYVEEISPWKYFKDQTHIKCPAMIMIDRWDGRIGFPGGTVEEGETLQEALVREIKEEIGINIRVEKLKPVVSYEWKIVSHTFALELKEIEFHHIYYHILNNFSRSILNHSYESGTDDTHFLSEITGIKIVPILNRDGKGMGQFIKNNFAVCGKEDIGVFLDEVIGYTITS
ncbi:MAG: NUDIX hydrolase [Campylobacterota bacterium]|nr:NUDIX hydrolase [Campylobacterota bacterium]